MGMGSAGLKVWISWGGMLRPGKMNLFSLPWDLRLPLGHLRFFFPPGENSFLVLLRPYSLDVISSTATDIQMSVGVSQVKSKLGQVLAMATAVMPRLCGGDMGVL